MADIIELQATFGVSRDIEDAVTRSAELTPTTYVAVLRNGRPAALFGVSPVPGNDIGVPWLLGTDEMDMYPREIVLLGKALLAEGLERHGFLCNYVDSRNEASIRWLKHIGFTVHKAQPYGFYGLPFHMFSATRQGGHEHETIA